MKIKHKRNIFPGTNVARYNLAAWQKENDTSVYLLGREVTTPGGHGEPDMGTLKLFQLDKHGKLVKEKIIWKSSSNGINLEDPRIITTIEEDLVIGLTAVLRDENGSPVPYPALIHLEEKAVINRTKAYPPILLVDTFGPGKNFTPIDPTTFIFRPDPKEYFHTLFFFSFTSSVPEKIAEVKLPTDLHWATWRMGTGMQPIWITPNEALFIIHGISLQVIEGKEKYVYSIGRAKLTRTEKSFQITVAPEPIITPDDFLTHDGKQVVEELHPDLRRVVYNCGGIIKKHDPETLLLYVNVGDKTTYEVGLAMSDLKEGLFA